MRYWVRMIVLMINIVLCFITDNSYVVGITYGINIVIIAELIGENIVRKHNIRVIRQPLDEVKKIIKEFGFDDK